MARDQFRNPPAARFQPPDEPSDLMGGEAVEAVEAEDQSKWLGFPEYKFETVPYDGAPVDVASEKGQIDEAVWRQTRTFDIKTGVWKITGFWAKRNHGGQKLGFEPVLYRKSEE